MNRARLDVDLTDVELYRNGFPHELFVDLRQRGGVLWHDPVVLHNPPVEMGFWALVRHAPIREVSRDWERFAGYEGPAIPPSPSGRRGSLVSTDPPDHSRLRRLISAGFTPRMVGRLHEHIADRVTALVDAALEAGDCDFVRDLAYPLPMHIIADIVGIPEADRPWVFNRTDVLLTGLTPGSGVTEDERRSAEGDLYGYASELGRAKRANPTDDVWTILAHAEVDDGAGGTTSLAERELDLFFPILTIAGSETTRNALSQGILALMANPDQWQALVDDPQLVDTATDEVIRWASPVLFFARTATRDTTLDGQDIAAGDRVVMFYPSGNRDETAFDDPFRFDIARSPNPHVSFGGGGPHYCLGANLAKEEIRTMLGELARRTRLELGEPSWLAAGPAHNVGVSVERLPVSVSPR